MFLLTNHHHARVYSYWLNNQEQKIEENVIAFANERKGKFYLTADVIQHSPVSDKCSYLISSEASFEELRVMARRLNLGQTLKWEETIFTSPSSPLDTLCLRSNAGQLAIAGVMNAEWWKKFVISQGISSQASICGDEAVNFYSN